ncbi:histidine--tRNA ligase, putative [Plasmodium ovale wallikeri]|uniref:histidine--tRNA ligase n=1 Tax=Plasmodium ovale wallikeri TaxID=864142 RepID=A0A1A8YRN5_PLAOA|nr:histidine--tRNA ligase, putative [Plasmodium ovale wallikeri]
MQALQKCALVWCLMIEVLFKTLLICRNVKSEKNISFLCNIWKKRKKYKVRKSRSTPVSSVKGMRTFNTRDYEKREHLFKIWKDVAESFSFSFYDLPVLEDYTIFQKSTINESYDFVKNGRHLTLRPEITPQLVRYLFIKDEPQRKKRERKKNEQSSITHEGNNFRRDSTTYVIPRNYCATSRLEKSNRKRYKEINFHKVFKMCTIGQCFRYEKTSKCRKREHYQWNIDIIGIKNTNAEIEIFSILFFFFEKINIMKKNIIIKINDKKIIQYIITKIFKKTFDHFSPEHVHQKMMKKILHTLDKYHKISKSTFKLLLKKNIPHLDIENINYFTNVIHKIHTLPHLDMYLPSAENISDNLRSIYSYFEKLNLHSFFEIDLTIVRGLDYYNNIIFEVFYKPKKYRAICGGGRYDFVLKNKNISAVGFGMGDVVVSDILFNTTGLTTPTDNNIHIVSFFPYTQNDNIIDKYIHRDYYDLVHVLRCNNVQVYSLLENNIHLSKALKKANSLRASYFLFFEEASRTFILKQMQTGEQTPVNAHNVMEVYSRE